MPNYVKAALWAGLVAVFAGGLSLYAAYSRRLVDAGEIRIDPQARLRPDRTYTLVAWIPEVPLPWEATGHRETLREAVDEFRRAYPNVEVTIEWLPWDGGHARLREALARGVPPDVYAMPFGVRKFDTALQIPVGPYMSPESRQDHTASALAAVAHGGREWAWPAWILPHVWVARADLDEKLAAPAGRWTTGELFEILAEVRGETGARGLAVNAYDPALLVDVMLATTGRGLFDEMGGRAWSVEELEQGIAFFADLIERGLVSRDAEQMSRTRLAQFWERRAALIAPVNPWLLRHILARAGVIGADGGAESSAGGTPKAVAVPPPAAAEGRPAHPATAGGFVVFRQQEYQGDDHTRAAMSFAEHLARRVGPWMAAQLLAVPAHPTALEGWRADTGLPAAALDRLIAWADRAVTPPILDALAHQQEKAVEQVIAAEFPKIWQGASPRSVAEAIARRTDGLRAEVPAALLD